jgi:dTDP-4-amino-4,6-dideoxy-D-galactose acyltransferase
MSELKQLVSEQQSRLFFYAPYNFLRGLDHEQHLRFLNHKLSPWYNGDENYFIYRTIAGKNLYYFLFQYLPWDSNYFQHPTYKLFTVLYPEADARELAFAVAGFKAHLASEKPCYCFIDIPAEDILLLQALTANNFRLTETRLTFFHDQVADFHYERFPVRAATEADIPALRKVAAEARNDFDRYHADTFFTPGQADTYLATYAEACVKGLCETVLVPDAPGLPTEAFLAISRLPADAHLLETSLARVVLTAVGSENKGWHVKLVAETLQLAKESNCRYVLMTTQATNRAVFRTSEKLGFRLGNTTHILAITL